MAKVHTLVMHLFPDIETLFMSYLLTRVASARDAVGIADDVAFKFIPSGALRAQDWEGEDAPNAEALEEKGFLFLDCGGGRFDQHGKPVNALQNTMSSLDLLVHATDMDRTAPHLMPLVEIISKNDLTGQDVARDPGMKKSRTPHTPRHLRNIVQGWNMLHQERPSKVLDEAHVSFDGIVAALASHDGPANELFLIDQLAAGVEAHFRVIGSAEDAKAAAAKLRASAERALDVMERDWTKGVNDYWNSTRVADVSTVSVIKGAVVHRTMAMAAGDSVSHRYGQVTRLGNGGPNHKLPHPSRKRRPKADITIQFRGEGRFIISTRGIELDRVARVLREADLRKKGVRLADGESTRLDATGTLTFTAPDGSTVSSLYLAEYRTCFGNTFRTNPYAEPSALTRKEVIDLTVKALGDLNA